MSKQHQHPPEGKLPLPQPRSPQELDDKILSYARTQAPRKNSSWIARWTSGWTKNWTTGLATAGIVVIAVFITQIQQPSPSFHHSIKTGPEQRYSDDTVQHSSLPAPAPASARPSTGMAPMKKAMKLEAVAEPRAQQNAGAIAREELADSEMASDSATIPNAAAYHAIADTKERARMDARELDILREHLAQLLQQGDETQAREKFQALRQRCPDCDLPETLALWLADQPESAAP